MRCCSWGLSLLCFELRGAAGLAADAAPLQQAVSRELIGSPAQLFVGVESRVPKHFRSAHLSRPVSQPARERLEAERSDRSSLLCDIDYMFDKPVFGAGSHCASGRHPRCRADHSRSVTAVSVIRAYPPPNFSLQLYSNSLSPAWTVPLRSIPIQVSPV